MTHMIHNFDFIHTEVLQSCVLMRSSRFAVRGHGKIAGLASCGA